MCQLNQGIRPEKERERAGGGEEKKREKKRKKEKECKEFVMPCKRKTGGGVETKGEERKEMERGRVILLERSRDGNTDRAGERHSERKEDR